MYSLIRILLFLAVFLILIVLISKSRYRSNRKTYILSAVICFILCSLLHGLPIENYIYSFGSAEDVFSYTNWEKIQYIVDGEDSCLVVYETSPSTYSFSFIGKEKDSYKILPQYSAKMISHKSDENGIIDVYRVKNTDDFYILATLGKYGDIQVCDEQGILNYKVIPIGDTGFFYIYVNELSESSHLVVNDIATDIFD